MAPSPKSETRKHSLEIHPPTSVLRPPLSDARFQWVDSVRGMAMLWIVYFHCLLAYGGRYPWPVSIASFGPFVDQCAAGSSLEKIRCAVEALVVGLIQRGPEGVGAFIVFSGFGLTYSLIKKGHLQPAWKDWYRRRFIRLYPIYWIAHVVLLISPVKYKPDPVDYRFLLSFIGDRVYPVREMFFYFTPAWWFFGLLVELYLAFPLLFRLMQRIGGAWFLALCIVAASSTRYVLFGIVHADGNWVQGAFFVCRLWEFAAGMVLGKLLAESPEGTLKRLFSPAALLAGIAVYALGLWVYQPNFLYSFSDGLTATGLSVILIHVAARLNRVPIVGKTFIKTGVYSYGLYLLHQPFVMYAGDKLQPYGFGFFLALATGVIVIVTLFSIFLEKYSNRAVNSLVRQWR